MNSPLTWSLALWSLLTLAVAWLSSGCALLLTGSTDPAKVAAIMDSVNARGCIFARASATPWASATTVIVGTWGEPAPDLATCWEQLPTVAP